LIVRIPADAMVVLVGPSGSGKSTFASRHFLPTQVLSSDALRALVADDANDQTATEAAFELLHSALAMRLVRRKLTVVDATSVEGWARQHLLSVARRLGRTAAAIVFNLPLARMRTSLEGLAAEGFAPLVVLSSPDEADAVVIEQVSP
jgi:protein phosphatase